MIIIILLVIMIDERYEKIVRKYRKYRKYVRRGYGGESKIEKFNRERGTIYAPDKYFEGLTIDEKLRRLERMKEGVRSDSPETYRKFETDYRDGKRIKTKESQYTRQWKKYFPDVTSLSEKSKITGVPLEDLTHIYKKGLAAWRTGHRPGANQEQWGHARVNSFLVKGKTFYTADNKIARKNLGIPKVKKWFNSIDGLCDEPDVKSWCKLDMVDFDKKYKFSK